MINYTKILLVFLCIGGALGASAQSTSTTSSPYSRYGLGNITDQVLPQTRGMGGIGAAINQIGGFSNINVLNPASYSALSLTTFDIGVYSNITTLSQGSTTSKANSNFRLSHLAFGVPVSKRSALSFGLLPYSELGYSYINSSVHKASTATGATDTTFNSVYSGDGGLSKAYIGYGFGIGKHIKLGGNVSYIFGNLHNYSSVQFPDLYGTFSSRIEQSNAIGGVNYDVGAQYSVDFSDTKHLTFGYSSSLSTKLTSQQSYIVSQYTYDASGNENLAADTLVNNKDVKTKISLPLMQHFGISYQSDGKFLIGADYNTSKWSNFTMGGVNQGLQNSESYRIGGQITPDINALHSYFARMDYRLGFHYDKTYINVNSTDIKQYAATFGLGFPLPRNNNAFYKINFSAELGKRGTLENNLVQEKFVNFHLSFLLNDRWFLKYKYD